MKGRKQISFIILVCVAIIIFLISFLIGRYPVSPFVAVKVLFSKALEYISFGHFSLNRTWTIIEETIVLNIRFPRIVAAFLIGAALSVSGASFQAIFRNPMISPDLLGASSGAGFGASIAIIMGGSYFSITLSSFAFGLVAVFLALVVSKASRINSTMSFILAGVMISSLFSSGTSFIKLIADTDNQLPAITYWLMGSLSSIKKRDLLFASIPIILGLVPIILLRWRINLLTLSEAEAKSMGVNTQRLRFFIILFATLMTAGAVSVSGIIGWVGLVIPHFSRLIFGENYKDSIPTSLIFGGAFLMLVDNIARVVSSGEIPLGILTSFIGAPLFLYLIITGGNKSES